MKLTSIRLRDSVMIGCESLVVNCESLVVNSDLFIFLF